ncbi:MAG: DNA methyltransferase [Phycisphaerae bacterium]
MGASHRMDDSRRQDLAEFAAWARKHITGDEKGEAQVFLDRLFQAFGQGGIREAGATLEMRIRQTDNKGTAFADLVWKPVVLIEMKKRGQDLSRHYRQAFDYWTRLVPGRPRYAVLCNFDEFWVYDFETQMDTPVDKVTLDDLPDRYGPLNFLFPTQERPVFGNDHEAVTRDAADKLAICFNKLIARNIDRPTAQKFILQMLVALFAEDIGLMDRYFVTNLLADCRSPTDSFDLLGGLFEAMNSPVSRTGGRFKGVPYFNGGLFAAPARLELYDDELAQLRAASNSDWSKVRPEIFGTLFEHSLDKDARHAFGQHFTSPVDIMKIVGPTIVEPWRREIESAATLRRLRDLHQRMQSYTVLDPACGSGNFLYIAYRELKRLEARLIERIKEFPSAGDAEQLSFGFVTARQFYGMDISPFACELAKVTMMIARKLAIDELHITEPALPLDNLDDNFIVGDALLCRRVSDSPEAAGQRPAAGDSAGQSAGQSASEEGAERTPWPRADAIIGNPPFLGAKRLKPERGADYVNAVRNAYPDVPGMADYCVYWLRKAHDRLAPCTAADPLTGRAGLVGTQNIRNNQSRVGGLDHIVKDGTIIEAVDNQPWSGEANVHVSIVNWVKTQDPALLPARRKLWSKVNPPPGPKKPRKPGQGPASKEYELAFRDCSVINPALSDQTDITQANLLTCNQDPHCVFRGLEPGNMGFLILPEEAKSMLGRDPECAKVIHPYLTGRELLTGDGTPERWLIDFQRMTILEAMKFGPAFDHVKTKVLPQMQAIATAKGTVGKPESELDERINKMRLVARVETWWQLRRCVPGTVAAVTSIPRYIVCSLVTKRPVFVFLSNGIRPSNLVQSFAFADDYSFGILQSGAHWLWFTTKCSKLKSDFRYTPESVFDTFPWPQSPTPAQVDAVAAAGREIRRIRAEALAEMTGGLRALYRTLELPGRNPLKDAHAALDAAVMAAYGFDASKDLLAQLLALNLAVAGRIARGETVTAPGVPPDYSNQKSLVTDDCIRPQ